MNMQFRDSKAAYELERDRLLAALGNVVEGGIVEAIAHIGATSVPHLHGSSCIDIGLAVWPFPLEAGPGSRLEALGYKPVSGYEGKPEQRFRHESGSFALYLVEPGLEGWSSFLLVRDYLRADGAARDEVSHHKQDVRLDKARLFETLLLAARRWWIETYQFTPVEAAAGELKDAPFPWYIGGGWALDLFLRRVNRLHHDVDVVVPRSAQLELQRHLTDRGWKLITPFEKRLEPWPPHMKLELPRHQVHAHREEQFMEFLLTEMDGVWQYRREPSVIRSLERTGLTTENGIYYLAPELVLLFKSRNTGSHERPKDQSDFERALPYLEPERRAWLHWALVATSPEHPWIKQLTERTQPA
jgi:GrpB-like predicted nucleotidyltransferase (UPF0157 family)